MQFMEVIPMAGRKPLGPALVAHLDGSAIAKGRLELILETLAAQVTVVEACRILDISEAMFYKLRNRVLQVCLEDLEPKRRGRRPQLATVDHQRAAELAAEAVTLGDELAAQTVRLELARVLPQLGWHTGAVKKTKPATRRGRSRRKRPRK
jgi:Helix-turn-helix domain